MPPELAGLGEPLGSPSAPFERWDAPAPPLTSVGVLGAAGETCVEPLEPLEPLESLEALDASFLSPALFDPLAAPAPEAPLAPEAEALLSGDSARACGESGLPVVSAGLAAGVLLLATFLLAGGFGHFACDRMAAELNELCSPFMPQKPGMSPRTGDQATPGISFGLMEEEPDELFPSALPEAPEACAPELPEASFDEEAAAAAPLPAPPAEPLALAEPSAKAIPAALNSAIKSVVVFFMVPP